MKSYLRRGLALLLVFCLVLPTLTVGGLAAGETFALNGATVSLDGENDSTVTVTFTADTAVNLTAFAFDYEHGGLDFNEDGRENDWQNAYLNLQSLTLDSAITGAEIQIFQPSATEAGGAEVSWMNGNGAAIAAGAPIFTATYTVKKDTPAGTYLINLENVKTKVGTEETVTDSFSAYIDVERPNDAPVTNYYRMTFLRAAGEAEEDNIYYEKEFAENTVPTVEYQKDEEGNPVYPTKESTAQYSYTFSGWTDGTNVYPVDGSVPFPPATADKVYTPTFTETVNTYTVTWKDDHVTDGTDILEVDEGVAYGATPAFNSDEPTKSAVGTTAYEFDGWQINGTGTLYTKNEETGLYNFPAVTGDVTYVAHYHEAGMEFLVTFIYRQAEDGEFTEETAYYRVGQTPTLLQVPAEVKTSGDYAMVYTFTGWDKAASEVTGAQTYTAQYSERKRTPTVTVYWETDLYPETAIFEYYNQRRPADYDYDVGSWVETGLRPGVKIEDFRFDLISSDYYAEWLDDNYGIDNSEYIFWDVWDAYDGGFDIPDDLRALFEADEEFDYDAITDWIWNNRTFSGGELQRDDWFKFPIYNKDIKSGYELDGIYDADGNPIIVKNPNGEGFIDYSDDSFWHSNGHWGPQFQYYEDVKDWTIGFYLGEAKDYELHIRFRPLTGYDVELNYDETEISNVSYQVTHRYYGRLDEVYNPDSPLFSAPNGTTFRLSEGDGITITATAANGLPLTYTLDGDDTWTPETYTDDNGKEQKLIVTSNDYGFSNTETNVINISQDWNANIPMFVFQTEGKKVGEDTYTPNVGGWMAATNSITTKALKGQVGTPGTAYTFYAIPDVANGWKFEGLYDAEGNKVNPYSSSGSNTRRFSLTCGESPTRYTAKFTQVKQNTITVAFDTTAISKVTWQRLNYFYDDSKNNFSASSTVTEIHNGETLTINPGDRYKFVATLTNSTDYLFIGYMNYKWDTPRNLSTSLTTTLTMYDTDFTDGDTMTVKALYNAYEPVVGYTAPAKIASVATRQAYPWTLEADGSLKAGNSGVPRSYSYLRVRPNETGVLHFQYKTSAYAYGNYAYDYMAWNVVSQSSNDPTSSAGGDYKAVDYSGVRDWTDGLAIPVRAGQDVRFYFYNYYADKVDNDGNPIDNQVWIRNLELETGLVPVSFKSDHTEWGTVASTGGVTDGKANLGDNVYLRATSVDGGQFIGWFDDATGAMISSYDTVMVTILKANQSYTAKFAPPCTGTAIADLPTKNYIKFDNLDTALSFAASGDTVRILDNFTLTKNTTIPSGVTLLIPLSASDTTGYARNGGYDRNAWIAASTYLYKTFTVNSGVTLTVNGYLKLGATQHRANQTAQGHISGAYSQIVNNGNIVINSSGKGYNKLLGLVTGSGTLTMSAGSGLNIPFQVLDYAGGTNTESLYNSGEFPFRQFATNNIQCKFVQNGGSYLYGDTSLYFWSSIYAETVDLVCPSSGLIYLPSGSKLTYTYDQSKAVNHTSGTNCNDFGKTTITIDGNATMGRFYIEGYGSTGKYLNLPWTYDVVINSGTTTLGYWLRVMPGAKLTVNNGATLNVNGRLVAPEGWHNLAKSGKLYPTMAAITAKGMKAMGEIVVNGTMNINSGAYFAGIAETTGNTGKIVTNSNANLTGQTFTTGSTGGYTNDRTTYTQNARLHYFNAATNSWSLVNMEKGKTYCAVENTATTISETITHKNSSGTLLTSTPSPFSVTYNGRWATDLLVTFNANGGEGEMDPQDFAFGVKDEIIFCDFSRLGYDFVGWNTKADGTGTGYEDSQEVTFTQKNGTNLTLYAQWQIRKLTVEFRGDLGTRSLANVTYDSTVTLPAELAGAMHPGYNYTWSASGDIWTPNFKLPAFAANASFKMPDVGDKLTITITKAPKTFAVHFAEDTLTGNTYSDVQATYNATYYDKLPTPEAPLGYEPVVWQKDGQTITAETLYTDTQDITLTAVWNKETYTVEFTGELGDKTLENVVFDSDVALPEELADAMHPGYNYAWSVSGSTVNTPDFSLPAFAPEATFKMPDVGDKLTINITKAPKTFTVHFAEDTLTGNSYSDVQATYNATYFDKLPTPEVPLGYEPVVWQKDGQTITAETLYTDTQDITLTAVWNKETYTVEFTGELGDKTLENVVFDSDVALPEELADAMHPGYNYAWSVSGSTVNTPDFSLPAFAPKATFKMPDVADKLTITITKSPKNFTISFAEDTIAGKTYAPVTATYGEAFEDALPDVGTVPGYDWDGWYYGDTKVDASQPYAATSDVELRAVWTKINYTASWAWSGDHENPAVTLTLSAGDHEDLVISSTEEGSGITITEVEGSRIASTCTAVGTVSYAAGYTLVDSYSSEANAYEIPMIPHTIMYHSAGVAPTCTENGVREFWICSACTKIYDAEQNGNEITMMDVNIPALGHDFGEVTYVWNQTGEGWTCTATRVCSRDETHVETETVTAAAEITKAATCEDMGDTTYTASFENEAFAPQTQTLTDVPALGHSWSAPTYAWTAIEDENGAVTGYSAVTATRICAHDETHVETETAALTHVTTLAPDCENPGVETYTATFTNTAFATQTQEVSLPALGHSWSEADYQWVKRTDADAYTVTATVTCANDPEGAHKVTEEVEAPVVITPATCEEDGVKTYTATFASDHFSAQTKTEAIEKLGHDWNDGEITTPATCVTDGVKTFTCRHDADHTYTETIPATGHSYGQPVWTWNEDHTQATATFTCTKEDCAEDAENHTVTLTATTEAGITSQTTEASHLGDGETVYTATVNFGGIEYTTTDTVVLTAEGHQYSLTGWSWNETFTEATASFTCSVCGEVETVSTTEITQETVTPAGCTAEGTMEYVAGVIFRNATYETTTTGPIPMIAHSLTHHDAVAPSCTAEGTAEYWYCETCGQYFSDEGTTAVRYESLMIEKLPHTYGEPAWSWNGHESATATFTCTACGDAQVLEGALADEMTAAPTEEEAGERTYTATVTFQDKTYTDQITEAIPALGYAVYVEKRVGALTPATVTLMEGNYLGEVTFQVSCANACVVGYTADFGESYTKLAPTKVEGTENTYSFTLDVHAVTTVVIALKGDVDGNGKLTSNDSSMVNRHIVKTAAHKALEPLELLVADVDGNGKITSNDSSLINRAIVKTAAHKALVW